MKLLNDTKDVNRLWRQVAEKHAEQPYQLLMMGGDQLYCDSIWDKLAPLQHWASLPLNQRVKQPFTDEMRDLGGPVLCRAIHRAVIAGRDGSRVGSSAEHHDVGRSRYFRRMGIVPGRASGMRSLQGNFAIAREYFALYQMQLARDEKHPLSIRDQQGFSLGVELGALTLLVLDMRSERTRSQVISPESWKGIYDWLDRISPRRKNQIAAVQHLLVMSSIPVVHPDFALLEKLLASFQVGKSWKMI